MSQGLCLNQKLNKIHVSRDWIVGAPFKRIGHNDKRVFEPESGGRSEDVLLEFGRRKKKQKANHSPGKPSRTSQQLLKEREVEERARASELGSAVEFCKQLDGYNGERVKGK